MASPVVVIMILRGGELLCSFLVFVLGGIIQEVDIKGIPADIAFQIGPADFSAPSAAAFNLFAGLFGIISVAYIIAASLITQLSNFHYKIYVFFILEFLNWVFFLAAFASLAGGYSLGSIFGFKYSACDFSQLESDITGSFGFPGSADPLYQQLISYLDKFKTACSCEKAAIAFGVIGWLLWTVTLVLVGYELWKMYYGDRSHSVPPPAEDVKMDHIPSSGQPIVYSDQEMP